MPNGYFNWCFTLNNYESEEYTKVLSFLERDAKYWIIGKEIGEGGTPHLQGFMSLQKRCIFNSLRDKLGSRFHIESARGTARQNREYCIKDGDYLEGGAIPKEGRKCKSRDELASEFRLALTGGSRSLSEFADSNPGAWAYSGHQLLRNSQFIVMPIARPSIYVEWLYGVPGVGKSRRAHDRYPDAYIKEPRTKWWSGYLQQKEVIIDDFASGGIDMNHLLRWFDRYKCLVETKGGMLALHADKFIVTSNFHPRDIFNVNVSDSMDHTNREHPQLPALMRRITCIEMY